MEGGVIDLNQLSDVNISNPQNGQYLSYNSTSNKWENSSVVPGQTTNPNLLLNPWFTVNQRGFTSDTISSEQQYTVDRWIGASNTGSTATFALTSSGFSISTTTNQAYIQQRMEDVSFLNGKTVTFSIMLGDGTIKSNFATINTSSSQNIYEDDDIALRFSASVSAFQLTVKTGKTVVAKALKLELGSTSTLALDTAPDYTTELLKCQRYFRRIGSVTNNGVVAMAFSSTATNGYALIPLSVPMRTLPTVTISGNYSFVTYTFTYFTVTVSVNSASDYRDRLFLNLVGTNLPTNTSGILVSGATSYIDLSSEL